MTGPPRVLRRSLAARLASLVALLLAGSAVALRAAAGEFGAGFAVAGILAAAAAAGTVSAWGDRFTFDDEGVTWENAVLGRFGRRHLAWREVTRVQAHRALFLVPARGRRLALDALEDPDEVRRRVERGIAAVSTPPAGRLR